MKTVSECSLNVQSVQFFLGYVKRNVPFYYFAHITGRLLFNVLLTILDECPTKMLQKTFHKQCINNVCIMLPLIRIDRFSQFSVWSFMIVGRSSKHFHRKRTQLSCLLVLYMMIFTSHDVDLFGSQF